MHTWGKPSTSMRGICKNTFSQWYFNTHSLRRCFPLGLDFSPSRSWPFPAQSGAEIVSQTAHPTAADRPDASRQRQPADPHLSWAVGGVGQGRSSRCRLWSCNKEHNYLVTQVWQGPATVRACPALADTRLHPSSVLAGKEGETVPWVTRYLGEICVAISRQQQPSIRQSQDWVQARNKGRSS